MMNNHTLKDLKQKYQEPHMSERQVDMMKKSIQKAKQENKTNIHKNTWIKTACAAAAVAAFLILPNTSANIAYAMEQIPLLGNLVKVITFRDYQYDTERHHADIVVPEIVSDEPIEQSTAFETLPEHTTDSISEHFEKSAEEINAEIQSITESFLTEFEQGLAYEENYQDITITSEVVSTTPNYFTLKLICIQDAGSGTVWNHYYTIDLNTGKRMELRDLFVDNADYITPISENIKVQMKEQMAADEMITYWLDSDVEAWNFKQITAETAFYINENGNLVISFNEGDVAPMYMGVVTFEIPNEAISSILKNK